MGGVEKKIKMEPNKCHLVFDYNCNLVWGLVQAN